MLQSVRRHNLRPRRDEPSCTSTEETGDEVRTSDVTECRTSAMPSKAGSPSASGVDSDAMATSRPCSSTENSRPQSSLLTKADATHASVESSAKDTDQESVSQSTKSPLRKKTKKKYSVETTQLGRVTVTIEKMVTSKIGRDKAAKKRAGARSSGDSNGASPSPEKSIKRQKSSG